MDLKRARSASGFEELADNCPAGTEVWQIDEDFWPQPPSLVFTAISISAGSVEAAYSGEHGVVVSADAGKHVIFTLDR